MARTIAKDHDQKREQILQNAAKVFATEGFDRASMSLLARECGISKANIYHYYDSKDALLFDILETYLRVLRDVICGIDIYGLSPEESLRSVVSATLKAYQGADYEHQVQIGSMTALPEDQQKLLRGYQRDMVTFVSNIVESLSPGDFSNNANTLRSTTMSVFGMLNWYYMWNSGSGTEAREDYADLVTKLVLGGVKAL
ncbi:TetR/AcrR family transcriptional regulator [uncultured Shimia sp.]|uniref:TetR/AcrR family transcriptional regulator n=1 Tax=uncultured Shimia sp. TaxID=573152 RepID=UPI0026203C50|nr:TetR/AcrR family transcriptional regulator [uncultured Shimia sp.]